ncbi:MAG TPA: DUF3828 domain-containing protein [Pyrinomonadaceae bacterium]|jgi:hypothetical protein
MRITKSILLLVTLLAGTAFSFPAVEKSGPPRQPSPVALVSELYKQARKEQGPFFQTADRALLDEYVEKSLADLIWKDALESQGEAGALDFDPLYDAQDFDIKRFAVRRINRSRQRAEVAATFQNFGKRERIVFLLVATPDGWKIADIRYGDGRTLSGIFGRRS